MDLTEAEDIKKRWQEYTEELYKKDLHDPDNQDGVITNLSHPVLFLCIFALITEENFLISPCSSLELCIQMGISFLFSFAFHFSPFSQLFVRPPQTAVLFFCISFSLVAIDPCLLYNVTSLIP